MPPAGSRSAKSDATCLLGLDLGTTRISALLYSPERGVLARAQRAVPVYFTSAGRVEHDALLCWQRSLEALREVLASARVPATRVAAVGLATQRATAVAWDAATAEPLALSIGWQDTRTLERVEELQAAGIPMTAQASATKFEWWLRNDPAVVAARDRGRLRLGTPDAWLSFCLTGGEAHVTDPGEACTTGLYDPGLGEFAAGALALFGIPCDALPRIVASSQIVGTTPASLFGAPIAVAARAGDQQASAFALGVHEPGRAKLSLGTSAMLLRHSGSAPPSAAHGLLPLALWRLSEGDSFHLEGNVVTAGAAIDWLVDLGLLSGPGEIDALARRADAYGEGFFVPSLLGLGSPFSDLSARALVGGLGRASGAPEIARALLEGIAERCADVADAMDLDTAPLPVDGGLSKSALLLQTLADLLGRTVVRAAEIENAALGAALLAGLASGVFASPAECLERVEGGRRFEPQLDAARRRAERARWSERLELIEGLSRSDRAADGKPEGGET